MMARLCILLLALMLTACGTAPVASRKPSGPAGGAEEVVLFSFGLLDSKYRYGGKNIDSGFDCSGLVSYVFNQAVGMRLTGNVSDIARKGRVIPRDEMQPGDLVFFNTEGPYSHVGIYLGDGRFIHAPSSKGKARVRTDSLTTGYFADRFTEARTYF
ncbi:MAG: C40 family peptidase [Zoogloeaceae bacterium]|jgi:cell wall-associated NlpC family hydrolase|nr:C40 family peptidase [Zoogloeaceae bacterium]